VLFSRDDVSEFVNANFEPVWVMVRPVPIVKIDFGDGKVLTRTLHGNILTSVCTADGLMLDALPGIYTPEVYIDRLDQFRLLAAKVRPLPQENRAPWVKAYHTRAAEAIKANQQPERFVEALKIAPVGKGRVERPTEKVLARGGPNGGVAQPPKGPPVAPPPVAGWKELVQDTELNESTRRRQIHELLAAAGLVAPEKVLKPIYKDVLHADLDDPYLGLGKTLFENYPFAEEDARK
jgi:hypothetical protein